MKKTLLFLSAVFMLGCSNSNSEATAENENSSSPSAEISGNNKTGCEALVLFRKGAAITGKSYDAAGKETSEQVITIADLTSEGSELTAHAKMSVVSSVNSGKKVPELQMNYKCDGKTLYTDLSSVLGNFTALKDAKIEGSALAFPLDLTEGQDLPDASVSITMNMGGRQMKTTSTYGHRKVESVETVTVPAGSWTAFKVSSEIDTDVDMGSGAAERQMAGMMKKNKPKSKMYMWYAPGVGIVKTESYSNDKLSSRSEVISIK